MNTGSDEQKIKLEHKYELRRLIVDKVLLGLIVGAVAFLGTMYLEHFKSSLTQGRFLLESRVSALNELRNEYSILSSDYFYLAKADDNSREDLRKQYKTHLDAFMATINKWSILFSEEFGDEIEYHYWFHQAPAHGNIALSKEHMDYGSEIFDDFDYLTRTALWEEAIGTGEKVTEYSGFNFEDKEDLKEFFEHNYSKWKTEKSQ